MQKDFKAWHSKKEVLDNLHRNASRPYYYERQIWWVAIGHNIGDEEDGKGEDFARPVLILRKFNQNLFYGLSLSTTTRRGRYYHGINCQDGSISVALLSHLRDYDTKRLLKKRTSITKSEFATVQQKLAELILLPSR